MHKENCSKSRFRTEWILGLPAFDGPSQQTKPPNPWLYLIPMKGEWATHAKRTHHAISPELQRRRTWQAPMLWTSLLSSHYQCHHRFLLCQDQPVFRHSSHPWVWSRSVLSDGSSWKSNCRFLFLFPPQWGWQKHLLWGWPSHLKKKKKVNKS